MRGDRGHAADAGIVRINRRRFDRRVRAARRSPGSRTTEPAWHSRWPASVRLHEWRQGPAARATAGGRRARLAPPRPPCGAWPCATVTISATTDAARNDVRFVRFMVILSRWLRLEKRRRARRRLEPLVILEHRGQLLAQPDAARLIIESPVPVQLQIIREVEGRQRRGHTRRDRRKPRHDRVRQRRDQAATPSR